MRRCGHTLAVLTPASICLADYELPPRRTDLHNDCGHRVELHTAHFRHIVPSIAVLEKHEVYRASQPRHVAESAHSVAKPVCPGTAADVRYTADSPRSSS